MIHGSGNCEKINNFTFVQKCPENYTRISHTNCKKDCSIFPDKIIIDYQCHNQQVEYLNDFEVFSSEEECNQFYEFCFEKKESDNQPGWFRDCPPHKNKIGFLCVPLCLSDMEQEDVEALTNNPRYCVEDYVNTGMPFYDLN
jgi:hypothetical protein